MWRLQSLFEGRPKHSWEEIQGQIEEQGLKKDYSETASPWDPPHMQPPNPSTIADAKKCLLEGTRYGCLLEGSARVTLIQMRMVATNHQTEHGDTDEGARERTEGAGRVCNPMGRTTLSTNQTLHNSHGPKYKALRTH